MIRLIVSDLDGTLLNSEKNISDDMQGVIKELENRGVIFAAASGRSRDSILSYFGDAPVAVIADNGGSAYAADGRLLFVGEFPYEKARPVIKLVHETSYMNLVLTGLKSVYILKDDPDEHKDFANFFFNNKTRMIADPEEAFLLDRIEKISISTGRSGRNEERGMELMRQFQDDFSLVLSGDGWVDLMGKGVSKGSTLEKMCGYYGVKMEETLAFGDYLNDLDMLMRTPNSYAMANAHPEVKKACANVTRFSNDENGVVWEIRRIFGLMQDSCKGLV